MKPAVNERTTGGEAGDALIGVSLGVAGSSSEQANGRREPPALVPLERQPRLTQRVFRQLRDAIVNSELASGQLVSIEQLAGMLGVSRTPVREALPALEQLGLITQGENGSFHVTPLDATYVWQVYAVRSALESLAVEVVAPALTDSDVRELRALALPPELRPDGDYSEMFGPDLALHDFVRAKCSLGFLNALIDSVRIHRSRLLDLEHSASVGCRKASYEEHRAIVEALERRDAKAARRLMQEHLDRVGSEVAGLARERSRTDRSRANGSR